MFSFFAKKPKYTRIDDKIYLTRTTADAALFADAKQFVDQGKKLFIVYFFDDTFKRMEQAGTAMNISFLKAEKLQNDLPTRSKVRGVNAPVFLFAEHHPSATAENALLQEIQNIFTDQKPVLAFYMALDEPMMQLFGGERIMGLMKTLGIKDNEAVSHPMITKSVSNAQEKISKKISTDLPAHSQQDWLDKNYIKS